MSPVKALGSTEESRVKLLGLGSGEEGGTHRVAVECVDTVRYPDGEGNPPAWYRRWSAKAWGAKGIRYPRSPRRKRCSLGVGRYIQIGAGANALSEPPGEYGRKAKTQENW